MARLISKLIPQRLHHGLGMGMGKAEEGVPEEKTPGGGGGGGHSTALLGPLQECNGT